MTADLFAVRSLLFLPASNPRAIVKARDAGADLVVLDLEDAVRPEDKIAARAAAIAASGEPWPCKLAIRINGIGAPWHAEDVLALAASGADYIVVPRVERSLAIEEVVKLVGKPIIAMIETAAGVLAASSIAREVAGLMAGTNDLAADLRLPPNAGREPLQLSLQSIVLAARAAQVAVFDGVFNRLDDAEGFAAECAESRRMGFDGKSLIHPSQVEACNRAFSPSQEEVEQAKALIAAFEGGAQRFDNRMIERMHVEQAKRVLERAGR